LIEFAEPFWASAGSAQHIVSSSAKTGGILRLLITTTPFGSEIHFDVTQTEHRFQNYSVVAKIAAIMKAIQVSQVGGPEALTVVDVPAPKPKADEAVVQIKVAGVNFIDVYFREGRYPATLPFINGQEASGVVAEVGSEVTNVKVGDRVAYTGALGSYAEYAAVPAGRLVKIPDALSFEQAAAAMLQGMTAHYLVFSTYKLQKNEIALVHAAAGGVGLLLVQMAKKKIGAQVIATAGTEDKAQLAREAGADHCIVYTETDFEFETWALTASQGVHVVYDGVGKATFDKDLNVLRPRGYLVLFGGASGAVPPFDLIKLSQKGSLYITRPTLGHYTATREELEWRAGEVMQWIVDGDLNLRIHHVYSLDEAQQAHRDLEGRKTTGKLLLKVAD
jgi:NADPH2:quinone reductase